jgi:hypothetical protein
MKKISITLVFVLCIQLLFAQKEMPGKVKNKQSKEWKKENAYPDSTRKNNNENNKNQGNWKNKHKGQPDSENDVNNEDEKGKHVKDKHKKNKEWKKDKDKEDIDKDDMDKEDMDKDKDKNEQEGNKEKNKEDNRNRETKNIPAPVRKQFTNDFPNAANVQWTKQKGVWQASFNNGSSTTVASYNANGVKL